MFLDAQTLLSDAQAVTADAASSNTYDTGAAGRDISQGEPLALVISVDTAADGTTTDETYAFQFIQSANADLSSPDVLVARTIGYANLTAGSVHVIPIPPDSITKRYVGAYYDVGGTSPSVTVTAWIAPMSMIQTDGAVVGDFQDGFTIS